MSNIFQTEEWTQFKVSTGYEKHYEIDDIFVLQKRLPLGRTMLYSPMVVGGQSTISSQQFRDEIKKIAKDNNSIFYRLELDIPLKKAESYKLDRSKATGSLGAENYIKSFEEMQPEHTLILDISKSEDEILAQMKQKGRYNIRLAEKNDVYVLEDPNVDNFYALYSTMAKRQKITYRDKSYYEKLIDILGSKGYVKILTAYVGQKSEVGSQQDTASSKQKTTNTPVASAIISFYKDEAIYLFGGSSDQHRNLMAPYLIQWTAIKEAKKLECKRYDFFGIAPDENPDHPWAGVTRFKKQFGGEEVATLGSYDLVFKPVEYKLFKLAEKIRRR